MGTIFGLVHYITCAIWYTCKTRNKFLALLSGSIVWFSLIVFFTDLVFFIIIYFQKKYVFIVLHYLTSSF